MIRLPLRNVLKAPALAWTLSAASVLGLSACVTATPYQMAAPGTAQAGGYAEMRVENDRWRVTFSGNSLTSRETVETNLLYRAAELTLAQGHDWFITADRGMARTEEKIAVPTLWPDNSFGAGGYWQPSWGFYSRGYGWRRYGPYWNDPFMSDPFWGRPGWDRAMDIRTIEKYEAVAEIVLGTGPKPINDPRPLTPIRWSTTSAPRSSGRNS